MARKKRIEEPGTVQHLINRGNYRRQVFQEDRTKRAFLSSLCEAHVRFGWISFAWAVMINHFHAATLTPQANLVRGMQWWLGTFAVRFNRFRREHGHLFQGRYKKITVDPETRLGPLCHYIHLNPVRAGAVTIEALPSYPWNSLRWLMHPKLRPAWYDPRAALAHAGNLPDTSQGRKAYAEYLRWLLQDEAVQKTMGFDQMTRGTAMGSPEFLRKLVVEHRRAHTRPDTASDDTRAALHHAWERQAEALLTSLGRTRQDALSARKSASWKLAIAAAMKLRGAATNRWLTGYLGLGAINEASRNIAAWQRTPDPDLTEWLHVQATPQTTHHIL